MHFSVDLEDTSACICQYLRTNGSMSCVRVGAAWLDVIYYLPVSGSALGTRIPSVRDTNLFFERHVEIIKKHNRIVWFKHLLLPVLIPSQPPLHTVDASDLSRSPSPPHVPAGMSCTFILSNATGLGDRQKLRNILAATTNTLLQGRYGLRLA